MFAACLHWINCTILKLVIHVFNRLTFESSVYNPLRARRPRPTSVESIWSFVDRISLETEKKCDLCNYLQQTGVDYLGRHETGYTVRMTNSFKIEKWHGMIITKKSHHPTNFSMVELEMLMKDAVNWAKEVETIDPLYMYPSVSWDVLYKAGASQIHPHIHVTVSPHHYYGSMEQYRAAAQNYFEKTNENYFSKLVEIYSSLGLAVQFGDAVALSTLAGKGDLEVLLFSSAASSDLFKLMYFTIKAYHELKIVCHSMSMAWSAVGISNKSNLGRIPAIIKIMSRGDCLSKMNDLSSLDLYLTNYRDHDPWTMSRLLRKKVLEYSLRAVV